VTFSTHAFAGGSVTPDAYVVRKADLAIQQRQIADKARMTVPSANGTNIYMDEGG
jgi:phosphoenolpyruvate synthase/pyruvate phosphate dikinase